ncbi:hypothetical protein L1987_22278 [Smallanthus sonchifolius]|uniref:Uncharacterized protein n=1 Tax=Smallanthus sonchifolius TaxID=185202 RepID=A0ACB9IF09_9ASTR|nr:hypothetical protein L1987_22278 [Smallanthus sonchifolius]
MNLDQSLGDGANEYELELISDWSTTIEPIKSPQQQNMLLKPDEKLCLSERALSATGVAFFSAVIVNRLDVAKLQRSELQRGYSDSRELQNRNREGDDD